MRGSVDDGARVAEGATPAIASQSPAREIRAQEAT